MAIEIAQVFQDFAVIMIVASVMTLISYKLKQPVIIGYIIAGMIIGPYTPPFSLILNIDILSLFAEIGVCTPLIRCRNRISNPKIERSWKEDNSDWYCRSIWHICNRHPRWIECSSILPC